MFKVARSIRSAVNETTGKTPFEMVYRRKILLPLDLVLGNVDSNNYKSASIKEIIDAQRLTRKAIEKQKMRQKFYYDEKRKAPQFKIGDLVLWFREKKSEYEDGNKIPNKFKSKWRGPLKIIAKIGKNAFRLQDPDTKEVMNQAVHAEKLKIFHQERREKKPPKELLFEDKEKGKETQQYDSSDDQYSHISYGKVSYGDNNYDYGNDNDYGYGNVDYGDANNYDDVENERLSPEQSTSPAKPRLKISRGTNLKLKISRKSSSSSSSSSSSDSSREERREDGSEDESQDSVGSREDDSDAVGEGLTTTHTEHKTPTRLRRSARIAEKQQKQSQRPKNVYSHPGSNQWKGRRKY